MFSKVTFLCLFILFLTISTFAFDAPNTAPLYRFVDDSGNEMYVAGATKAANLKKANPNGIAKIVGYVYLKKVAGTIPLFGLTKEGKNGLRFIYSVNINEILKKQNEGWTPIQENKGVICYVRMSHISKTTIGAWRFIQTAGSDPRWRFGFDEYDQWKKLQGVKFETDAGFYIWEKPIETAKTTGFDLRLVQEIYYFGNGDKPADKSEFFVIPKNTLSLKQSQARACRTGRCSFNLGFQIIRSNSKGELKIPVKIINNGVTRTAFANFSNGETTQTIKLPLDIPIGNSTLYISVDPDAKVEETDETNNIITMQVKVQ